MSKYKKITSTILLFTITFASIAKEEQQFLNQRQLDAVTEQLITNFERLDAITIDVRNRSRSVKWQTYKSWLTESIRSTKNWTDFVLAIDNFHYGIPNRHSYVEVAKEIRSLSKKGRPSWPAIPLGYTFPEISFFETRTGKSVGSFDDQPIADIFKAFLNYYCNDLHQQGCLKRFVKHISNGYRFADNSEQIIVGYADKSEEVFNKPTSIRTEHGTSKECENDMQTIGLSLMFKGAQSCLYQYNKHYLLKILEFGNWGNKFEDVYCTKPYDAGMCSDINAVTKIINKTPSSTLLIDLQNNGGGSENTPWVAALTANGFMDNLVEYKNIRELNHADIRSAMFYGSSRAKDWFTQLTPQEIKQSFLPARGDFCRGSKTCLPTLIKSNPSHINFEQLILITNSGCVSSCDDLVWRLKTFSKAKVVGQMPSTDGTYARLMVYIILRPDGAVESIISGEGMPLDFGQGQLLTSYRVPISRTVKFDRTKLEGNTDVLDRLFEVNKANFLTLDLDNIERALNLVPSK
jgi:hypothetical protein